MCATRKKNNYLATNKEEITLFFGRPALRNWRRDNSAGDNYAGDNYVDNNWPILQVRKLACYHNKEKSFKSGATARHTRTYKHSTMASSWSSWSPPNSPSNQRYKLIARLSEEAGDAINCLAISKQGNLLASGSK